MNECQALGRPAEVQRCGAADGAGSRVFRLATAAAAAVLSLAAVPAAGGQPPQQTVEGVWRVIRHGVDCATGKELSSFPAIMAFARGGSLTGYAVGPGSTPAQGSPDYGTWKREPGGTYSFRFLAYNYDTSGAFAGSTEVSANLELTDGGTKFTYAGTVQFFDAAGQPMFSVCGAATANRF